MATDQTGKPGDGKAGRDWIDDLMSGLNPGGGRAAPSAAEDMRPMAKLVLAFYRAARLEGASRVEAAMAGGAFVLGCLLSGGGDGS